MDSAIGISMGDPTGIGPELVVRVLGDPAGRSRWAPGDCPQVHVYGDEGLLASTAAALGVPWPPAEIAVSIHGITRLAPEDARPGQPGEKSGAAQVAYLEAALLDARAGRIGGLCTAPIHKASAKAAGLAFPGHTELLGARLGVPPEQVVMMLAGPSLRVALCTTHMALAAVPAALSSERIVAVLRTTVLSLRRDFGIAAPLVRVAGLNPHAGEGGHFGDEEERIIAPAIQRALVLPELAAVPGLRLLGPEVPDVVFRRKADAVVAMYHDQGLIPLKLLDFEEGVNVTLGLPLVRTSPDHGVAHDIAGRGLARPDSMIAALRLCREILTRRRGESRPGPAGP